MEGHGGGLVIALRHDSGFRDPDRRALYSFAESVTQRLKAERSVEIERLRYGMEARERERTRWAREIHDETVQGLGALRLKLANARDLHDERTLEEAVGDVLEGLGLEIERSSPSRSPSFDLRLWTTSVWCPRLRLWLAALGDRRLGRADGRSTSMLGADGQRLDAELESTIYRVVQEALTNVSRHAQATRAVISVTAATVVRSRSSNRRRPGPTGQRRTHGAAGRRA